MISGRLIEPFRRIDWLRPSVIALLMANCVPLVALFVFHWDVFSLMFLFWLENVIIGVLNIFKMLLAGVGAKDLPRYGSVVFWLIKLLIIPFFCLHYGGFTFAHGMFITAIFDKGELHNFGFPFIFQTIRDHNLEWPFIALVASHLISFGWDYLWSGEFRHTNPLDMMSQPYRRVIVMHVSVIVGAMLTLAFHAPEAALVFLVALKTVTDLWGHQKERERLSAEKTSAAAAPTLENLRTAPTTQNILQAAMQARAAQPDRAEKKQAILVLSLIVVFFGGALCFAGFVTYNIVSSLIGTANRQLASPSPTAAQKQPRTRWTLNADHTLIPQTTAAGIFRGYTFNAHQAELTGEVLTLTDIQHHTNRAFVIRFTPEQLNATANRLFQVGTNAVTNVPEVKLVSRVVTRKKNFGDTNTVTFTNGYAMQWAFGVKSKNRVPLQIYLCLPDAEKSYLVGTFRVTIKKEKAAADTVSN